MTIDKLLGLQGYQFESRRHAVAILDRDYPEVCLELSDALRSLAIAPSQVIEGGGGKSSITQAVERPLKERGWDKKAFRLSQSIDNRVTDSTTHEIDHFRESPGQGGVALEIEWNNKDPFYDRDLATFQRLHLLGIISVGIILTRGPSLRKP